MAQKVTNLEQEKISCSICLDLLKDPVTIPCGHSYCMDCIKDHWDTDGPRRNYSCPQCRKEFRPRPVLQKNIMLAALIDDLNGIHISPADHCYAGPEDVACDVCIGRKLKAVKSCLVCLASYCENHLQPHYDAPPLKRHKLTHPVKKLQEIICSRHDEVMKIFCRTDQQCICYLCLMDQHKGHETVPAEAERSEKLKELHQSLQKIQQRIQDQEKEVKLLQQEVEAINVSADKAVEENEKIFTDLINQIQKRSSDLKQQIRSKQETEVSRIKELQAELEQEITELKRKEAELEKLSNTEDLNRFLQNYPSLPELPLKPPEMLSGTLKRISLKVPGVTFSESTHSSSINIRPLTYFKDVTAAVSELREKIQKTLSSSWTTVFLTDLGAVWPAIFLKRSQDNPLDPNRNLISSDWIRKTQMQQEQSHPDRPGRFSLADSSSSSQRF
ncbi:E3 ubiquitin/ISG15 ligase TRIM25-like [Cyprinodon tularosa]|uniref:E3 ubiquitin/ISG15 ligase TRIM25-like n=1 Tax=Cyprinodon tularosa TaxID=77115 RepID=UPI0018E221C8|nr:E3 ubiquitin/ISG15 ligase TRIM25-like [Cyprinodon tularosa]